MKKQKINGIILVVVVFSFVFLYCIGCIVVIGIDNVPKWLTYVFAFGDIGNTAVGALLGFGASLFLENYMIKRSRASAIDNIVAEVNDMAGLIDNTIFACTPEELPNNIRAARFCIMLPIWESIVQNGDLLQFKKKSYFDRLILTYTYLIALKEEINSFDADSTDNNDVISVIKIRKEQFQKEFYALKNESELKEIFNVCSSKSK